MHKTILITLNKTIFSIEEDAYDLLKKYLASIRDYFTPGGEAEEILIDIESGLAEKLTAKGFTQEKVITQVDIEALIKIMGTINDIKNETNSVVTAELNTQENNKRLYRNPDDLIIAGVCSGLAAYFNLETVLVRLIFVISIFFGGAGILVYLVLWLIMPEAKTNLQKLEMQGAPITLKKLEENLKNKVSAITTEKNTTTFKRLLALPFDLLKKIINVVKIFLKKLGPILIRIIGWIMVLALGLTIFCLIWAACLMMFNLNSPYIVSDLPLTEILQIVPIYLTTITLFLIAAVPLIFLFLASLSLGRLKNSFKASVSLLLLALWLGSIILSSIIAVDTWPQIQQTIDQQRQKPASADLSQNYVFKNFKQISANGAYQLIINQGPDYKISALGQKTDLNNLIVKEAEQSLIITKSPTHVLCFFCSPKPVKLEITLPQLTKLKLAETASAKINNLKTDELQIKLSGASLADLNLTATSSDFYLSGASKLLITGRADKVSIAASGASEVSATKYLVNSATLNLSGASLVKINVKDNLQVKASGASQLNYFGQPQLSSDLSGAAQIIAEDQQPLQPLR